MKIAFVSTMSHAPWGGSEELWAGAAARLAESGLEVSSLVTRWPSTPAGIENLRTRRVRIEHFPRPGPVGRAMTRLSGRQRGAPYRRFLRGIRPAFVVVSQGGTGDGVNCMLECAERGIPYAAIVQANSELWWPEDNVRELWVRAYRGARRVFFVSHGNAELLESQLGLRLDNKVVVSNPWNIRIPDSTAWPSDRSGYRLACVARLEIHAKGQDLLLRSLARANLTSQGGRVSFFGAGAQIDGLRALALHLGLANVSFEGQVSDINAVWETHHLLVLPSRFEGSPLALYEAMWCGRPSIVTDVGGNVELCEDGVTGFVCRAPAVALLAETLDRAWEARARWMEMGAAARASIEAKVPREPIGAFCEILRDVFP